MRVEDKDKPKIEEQIAKGIFCFHALKAFIFLNDFSNSYDAISSIEKILKELKEKIAP